MGTGYRPSAAWRVAYEGGLLLLTAGADHVLGIEDVDEDSAHELLSAWESGRVEPEDLTDGARLAIPDLIDAGALVRAPAATVAAVAAVAVRWVGRCDEELGRHLSDGLAASRSLRAGGDDAELLLFVRTTGRLVEAYAGADAPDVPHLLLDLTYHHTVSVGPLVAAGETACLACLAGRIGQLWGDPPPPARPAILESPALAAALAIRELEKVAAGDVRLAGATAAYDLESHRVTSGSVYRLPWCPVCGDGGDAGAGRIDLPWSGSP